MIATGSETSSAFPKEPELARRSSSEPEQEQGSLAAARLGAHRSSRQAPHFATAEERYDYYWRLRLRSENDWLNFNDVAAGV